MVIWKQHIIHNYKSLYWKETEFYFWKLAVRKKSVLSSTNIKDNAQQKNNTLTWLKEYL